jgi:Kef-type K+ transport system membrane component KefB
LKIPSNNLLAAVCAGIGVSLYSIVSVATLMVSLNLIHIPIGRASPLNALLLAIIAIVLFGAFTNLLRNKRDGYAFLVVGVILAGLLFALQFIILGTNALGWMLQLEDWLAWKVVDDLTPQLWLFPIVLPILGLPWLFDYGSNLKNKGVKGND